jgi:tRNA-binding EMAP/Myf-like protein
VINGITGARVGEVCRVRPHPRGKFIWLADVTLGDDDPPHQIVFGGDLKLTGGELVPVALPGSWSIMLRPGLGIRRKKMRARTYRGQRSHGMLCSLDELGWLRHGPNEVAVLCDLTPGDNLDDLPAYLRPEAVVDWERAALMAKHAQTSPRNTIDPMAETVGT